MIPAAPPADRANCSDDEAADQLSVELQKFTTRYYAYQDRLCIDGQTAGGEVVSLWLTCRLMRQLIPFLVRLITPTGDSDYKTATLAGWALASACAQKVPEAAVRAGALDNPPGANTPNAGVWLVRSILLKSSPGEAVLLFRTSTNRYVARIPLRPEHLRQWLSIVYRLWRGAGWPSDEWPAWFERAEGAAPPGGAVLH